jgi:hypothetical protein
MTEYNVQDFEKATQSKFVSKQKIKLADPILGDNDKHILEFDIFDGFAVCPNYKGKMYYMTFPKLEFMKIASNIEKQAKEFLEIDEHTPLKVEDVLVAYNKLSVNE